MTDKLEKFKFATVKNVSVKVEEKEDKVEVRIEPLVSAKQIEIYYKPLLHSEEMFLKDDHKKIEIDRSFMVGTYDGDVDWDCEAIYPCDRCSGNGKYINELHEKIRLKDAAFDMMTEGLLMILDSFKKK